MSAPTSAPTSTSTTAAAPALGSAPDVALPAVPIPTPASGLDPASTLSTPEPSYEFISVPAPPRIPAPSPRSESAPVHILPIPLVPTSAPAPPYSPASTRIAAPPYAPCSIITPSPAPPAFANFHVFNHRTSPHEGGFSVMAISTGGKWLFTSTNDQEHKSFALTDAFNLTLSAVIHTGEVWVTAAVWASDHEFYVGFNNGRVYHGRLQLQGENQGVKLTWLATAMHPELSNTVVAIAFSKIKGYLAFATSRSVHILQRLDYIAASFNRGEIDRSGKYQGVSILLPYRSAEPNITSLAFYGLSRVNLVVGALAGLVVYSTYPNELRLLAATYEHQVSQCGTSSDGRILAASTPDNCLIYWPLAITGPLFHIPVAISLPPQAPTRSPPSVPSISITPANVVVGGMPNGQICFTKPATREKYLIRLDHRQLEVKAVAHGDRFYIASTNNSSRSIEVIAYSLSWADVARSEGLLGQSRAFAGCVKLLSEVADEPAQIVSGSRQARSPAIYFLAYLCFFSLLAAIAMLLAWLWHKCIAPLSDIQIDESTNPCLYVVYVGLSMVHYYTPRSLIAHASYVLAAVMSAL
ncbi:hypothetical protein FRC08_008782 [Ceratobasidium sp. 394]|nr:hypothetical protein FRC08_008782 [Ceratobasidium sp. 394]